MVSAYKDVLPAWVHWIPDTDPEFNSGGGQSFCFLSSA